jgi:hypothetical protein
MLKKGVVLFGLYVVLLGCGGDDSTSAPFEPPDPDPITEVPALSDEELLDLIQQQTFKYFWDYANTDSGAARERYHPNDPTLDANVVASGGTGFGLMGILVGLERGFISQTQAVERLSKILSFLENADRFHGAWPHWIHGTNGNVIPFSTLDNGGDIVETALLAQGLICIKEYFKEGTGEELALSAQADALWKGIEWDWYTNEQNTLLWHWSPNTGFAINLQLKGYNETLIAYVLAAASPDYSISKEVYDNGWASNGGIQSNNTKYGYPLLVRHAGAEEYGGPLFWAHYSFLGLNPNGLSDEYANYWEVNRNHAMINYSYCVENPLNYTDYGEDAWGLSASYSRNSDGSMGYAAHRPGADVGVISPTAAIASLPYVPEESMRAMHFFYQKKEKLLGPAGFYDAFSPSHNYWVAEAYLAIDQGPQLIMIENYRSGLLWRLFMQNEEVQSGLTRLGFNFQN